MKKLPLDATIEQIQEADKDWESRYSVTKIPEEAIERIGKNTYRIRRDKLPDNHRFKAPSKPSFRLYVDKLEAWRRNSINSLSHKKIVCYAA